MSSVVLNVTAANTTSVGYLSLWAADVTQPSVANVGWESAGKVVSTLVMVKLDSNGRFKMATGFSGADVMINIAGWHTTPTIPGTQLFSPKSPPARILDTATGTGVCSPSCSAPAAWNTITIDVHGQGGVPADATAVMVNVTASNPLAAGWFTIYPSGTAAPNGVHLIYTTGVTRSVATVAKIGDDGKITILAASGATDIHVDVHGWYRPPTHTTSTWSYRYTPDGLRRTKTTPSGAATSFGWDHASPLPMLLTETTDGATTAYLYGPGGLPIADIADTTIRYYHHDQLGSTRSLTSSSGAVTGAFTYDPYGSTASSTGTATTPLGYAGQYTDPETGLQYLRARYYEPESGQFLTRDPIESVTRQAYLYANNDPLNYTDPLGLAPWDWVAEKADDAWDATGGKVVSFIDDTNDTLRAVAPDVQITLFAIVGIDATIGYNSISNVRLGFGFGLYAGVGIPASGDPPPEADQFFIGVPGVTGSVQRAKYPDAACYSERYGPWESGYNVGPSTPSVGGGFAHWWKLW